MKEFKAPKDSFKIYINHRALIDGFLTELQISSDKKIQVIRTIDKFEKLREVAIKSLP